MLNSLARRRGAGGWFTWAEQRGGHGTRGRTPRIFISYSHDDEAWKDHVVSQLGVLEHEGLLSVWEDRQIAGGDEWLPAIETAMASCSVALLLISAKFLTSKFILSAEVPRLLQRREQEGVRVIPVILKPCPWMRVGWLKSIQARPKNGKPLSGMSEHEADAALAALAEEIADLMSQGKVAHQKVGEQPKPIFFDKIIRNLITRLGQFPVPRITEFFKRYRLVVLGVFICVLLIIGICVTLNNIQCGAVDQLKLCEHIKTGKSFAANEQWKLAAQSFAQAAEYALKCGFSRNPDLEKALRDYEVAITSNDEQQPFVHYRNAVRGFQTYFQGIKNPAVVNLFSGWNCFQWFQTYFQGVKNPAGGCNDEQ